MRWAYLIYYQQEVIIPNGFFKFVKHQEKRYNLRILFENSAAESCFPNIFFKILCLVFEV